MNDYTISIKKIDEEAKHTIHADFSSDDLPAAEALFKKVLDVKLAGERARASLKARIERGEI